MDRGGVAAAGGLAALIPVGLGFGLWAIVLTGVGSRPVELALGIGGIALLAVEIVLCFWQPDWVKPRWIREAERRERAGEPLDDLPMPAEGRQMAVSPWERRLAWILCLALVAGGIALGQTQGAIIGLAVALPILLAMKVRRRRAET